MTYMGMQIMVEGLALAAFGFMHMATQEPLLKKLLRYVMSDEARHVAFGVLSLQEYYQGLDGKEIRERQEFAFEAALRMRDRLMMHAVWEQCGIDREMITKMLFEIRKPGVNPFQAALFSKIVPNCKKLGLLDAGDGWLRDRFTDIGVIEYEDAPDTEIEYALLDAVAADREAEPAHRLDPADEGHRRTRHRVGRPAPGTHAAGPRSRPRVARCGVHHCTSNSTAPPAPRRSTVSTKRDLRGVRDSVEHRLAGEEPTDGDAVEPADERPLAAGIAPDLDAVRPAQLVERRVGVDERLVDPPARALGVGAPENHGAGTPRRR